MTAEGWRIEALCVGRPAVLAGGKRSAIAKQPVGGAVQVSTLGLDGDTQVDKRHHGGPEMAVHVYPLDHHAFWRGHLGDADALEQAGAFGSNVALSGIDETDVRIGERFRLGGAVLEVSQPRMPCATIERRFQNKGMVAAILESGRCGWYCRVIEEGEARAGDRMIPLAGTGTPYTVRAAFNALAEPGRIADGALLRELENCAALSPQWRAKASDKRTRHRL